MRNQTASSDVDFPREFRTDNYLVLYSLVNRYIEKMTEQMTDSSVDYKAYCKNRIPELSYIIFKFYKTECSFTVEKDGSEKNLKSFVKDTETYYDMIPTLQVYDKQWLNFLAASAKIDLAKKKLFDAIGGAWASHSILNNLLVLNAYLVKILDLIERTSETSDRGNKKLAKKLLATS